MPVLKSTLVLLVGAQLLLSTPGLASSPLKSVSQEQLTPQLGLDEQIWNRGKQKGDYLALVKAIDYSLQYLQTPKAAQQYQNYPVKGVTRDRVIRSLRRFRQLVLSSPTPAALATAVKREFNFYQAVGQDNQGTVDFTGYFEPTYRASRVPTSTYRYPLYRLPANFASWSTPHPTRAELEGADGLQASRSQLRGLELVWLPDRLQAFLVQVQGSARLTLTDGSIMTVGYAGKTSHPYNSIGKELVKDGKFKAEELTLPRLMQYFQEQPQELNTYIPRNNSFVFFKETQGAPATGSLGVPVTAERSIATDKSLMPPGALALMQVLIPTSHSAKPLEPQLVSRYVLDQDTGGAIKGPGRVDIFMGTGESAKAKAGLINTPGQLYYLLLKQ